MSRPLVITDCDEVLLHMVVPWSEWLRDRHGIEFSFSGGDFTRSMRHASGERVASDDMWRLLDDFFTHEMARQYPIEGAVAAMEELACHADVVVLTNLTDGHRDNRAAQLLGHGLNLRVFTNQGPKGPALRRIHAEYAPSRAVFIDDIAVHHGSVAELAPEVHRLHLCGEPQMAPHIRCAHATGHAHARIDSWDIALPWLLARLHGDTND
jgi:hypothetical protein